MIGVSCSHQSKAASDTGQSARGDFSLNAVDSSSSGRRRMMFGVFCFRHQCKKQLRQHTLADWWFFPEGVAKCSTKALRPSTSGRILQTSSVLLSSMQEAASSSPHGVIGVHFSGRVRQMLS